MKPFSSVPAHALLLHFELYLINTAKLTLAATGLAAILLWSCPQEAASQSTARSATAANVMPVQPWVPTLRASVEEVPLVLTVTDHKGNYVDNLVQSDLTILDNNHEQTSITFFEHQTNLPLSVAIVVDVSGSVAQRFLAEQGTIKSFVHSVARPSDVVNIFAFNESLELVAKVDNNWKEIAHRIKKLHLKGNTALYDALVGAADFLHQDGAPSRRVIIVITDGEENDSVYSLESSIAHALKAEAAIYAVNVSYRVAEDGEAKQGESLLKRLADATGGNYFKAGENGDLSGPFGKIRRELRSQYALAYRPSHVEESVFHQVQVLATRRLHVRCRSGYYVR
jgi:Ca-activated chloride channel homolog